jgi:predicted RNase H-like nuclease (RuvC/YqgF family)
MELDLKIIWAKNTIWIVRERIKNVRLKLEKEKPDAKDYINGGKDSEEQLLKTELVIIEMENEIISLNRELNQLAKRNAQLRVAYDELKNELKFKDIEL